VTDYGTHEEDCFRRDFTVNALYQNISTGEIIDITGKGLDDIREQIIRTPSDPLRKFDEDPLRILRCVRFAARFGWKIAQETFEAMKAMVPRMAILTKARMNEEFIKMMHDERPALAVRMLCDIGAMDFIVPENVSEDDFVALERMSAMSLSSDMRMAALMYNHSASPNMPEIQLCRTIQAWEEVTDACIREIQFRSSDISRLDNALLLAAAVGVAEDRIRFIRNRTASMLEDGSAMFAYRPILTGKEIMEIKGIGPGPQIKKCQDYLMALAFNNPLMTREEAIKFLKGYRL
jgi:tRNA nucleotidyltransferase/poly(A) polymerase